MRNLVMAFFTCIVLASPGGAQSNPDSVKHVNRCRLADQILRTGHPQPHQQWARGYIGYCGADAWGRAAAAAVARLRTSDDHRALEVEWGQLRLLRDSVLFAVASDIAGDTAASVPARVLAMRHLMGLVDPNRVFDFDRMTQGFDTSGNRVEPCLERHAAGRQAQHRGVALPSDYVRRITDLLNRIASDSTQPREVRSAASCHS